MELDEAAGTTGQNVVDLVALDDALETLARLDRRQSQIVELRFFGGLTEDEIAQVVGVSTRTVNREWRLARALLHHQLGATAMEGERLA